MVAKRHDRRRDPPAMTANLSGIAGLFRRHRAYQHDMDLTVTDPAM